MTGFVEIYFKRLAFNKMLEHIAITDAEAEEREANEIKEAKKMGMPITADKSYLWRDYHRTAEEEEQYDGWYDVL